MLALGIRYLNGFVAACEPDSFETAEWPPHPARVFMALAAAHFETGADPAEREALEWLEGLETSPCIRAGSANPRAVVTHYVPVNDKSGPATAVLQSAPALGRGRQPRTFARAWLEDEVVYVVWREAEPGDAIRAALETLCGKVTRIGHSSSLVQMWLASPDETVDPTWVPGRDRAEIHVRVAGPGTLEYLERSFNSNEVERWGELRVLASESADREAQAEARRKLNDEYIRGDPVRLRPALRTFEGYIRARSTREEPPTPGTVFSPRVIVSVIHRESGPYRELDLLCAPQVVQRWRDAILTHVGDLPEAVRKVISGHDREGAPVEEPHLAFLPMAFVGHPHADGHLLGMGIVLPESLGPQHRRLVLGAVARVDRLLLGRLGTWRIGSVSATEPPWNLRSGAWTAYPAGATHWSSVTPVAFDRHPKQKDREAYEREAVEMIAEACVRVGLPMPRRVFVSSVSAHPGVPPAHQFPRLQRKDGSRRRHVHVILVFDSPVRGPIILGAGRYRGYGACRPLHHEETTL